MSWSESSLHSWIFALNAGASSPCVGEPGSDAAVLANSLARPVLCVDQVVAGRHYTEAATPNEVGAKAVARALSDLAASAATPRALLLSLRADDDPQGGAEEVWLKTLIQAVWSAGRTFGAPLIGGDISAGDGPTSLSVTAIGEFEYQGQPPGREHAEVGDLVLLSGPVGGSLLGRHLDIHPPLMEGRWLYEQGARTLMDVSDGLALDLARIADRSRVAIELDLDRIPIHPDARTLSRDSGRSALEHALGDGEDHELIVVAPEDRARLMLAQDAGPVPQLCHIGCVGAGEIGLWMRPGPGQPLVQSDNAAGYSHGTPR